MKKWRNNRNLNEITYLKALWQFIIGRFAAANPIKEYLTTLTDVLDCKNVTILDNTLIFQNHGIKNYTIEESYNIKG